MNIFYIDAYDVPRIMYKKSNQNLIISPLIADLHVQYTQHCLT